MAVYRIKLFTQKEGVHAEGKDQQYCLERNRFAIGWGLPNISDFEKYKNEILNSDNIDINRGLEYSLQYIEAINENDYVWTQLDGRKYLLGKVKGKIFFDNERYRIGPCLNVTDWKLIDFDLVPGKIISCLVSFGPTLQVLSVDNTFEKYCEWLYTGNKDDILHIDNIKSLLHYDDLEDLLGLYLQDKYEYYIIPSTNKQSTKLIEYELRDKSGNKACVQCKIGNSKVKIKDIRDVFPKNEYKIFICTLCEFKDSYWDENIEKIPVEELIDWAKNHTFLLPERIKQYLQFMF